MRGFRQTRRQSPCTEWPVGQGAAAGVHSRQTEKQSHPPECSRLMPVAFHRPCKGSEKQSDAKEFAQGHSKAFQFGERPQSPQRHRPGHRAEPRGSREALTGGIAKGGEAMSVLGLPARFGHGKRRRLGLSWGCAGEVGKCDIANVLICNELRFFAIPTSAEIASKSAFCHRDRDLGIC